MNQPHAARPKPVQHLADGGLIAGLFKSTPKESISEKYRRMDAERAAARQPAAAPAEPAPAPAPAQPSIANYGATSILQRRERAAGLANGGKVPPAELIEGEGTGTSDSIPAELPEGSFVMPADSTEVLVSNGEMNFPPELLQAIGAAALDVLRAATHVPAAAQTQEDPAQAAAQEPVDQASAGPLPGDPLPDEEQAPPAFADGGVVEEERQNLVAQIPPSGPIPTSNGPLSMAANAAPAMPTPAPAPTAQAPAATPARDPVGTPDGRMGFGAGAGRGLVNPPAVVPEEPVPQFAASNGVDVGFGARRFDGGSSPLFTNVANPADNAALMGRGAVSEQNRVAGDMLADDQYAASVGRIRAGARREQEQREIAEAEATRSRPFVASTGSFGIRRAPGIQAAEEQSIANLNRAIGQDPMSRRLGARRYEIDTQRALEQQKLAQDAQQFGAKFGLEGMRFGADQQLARDRLNLDAQRAVLTDEGATQRARIAAGARTGAPAGYRWAADGRSMEVIPGGPAALKAGQAAIGKALPTSAATALLENNRNLNRASDALDLLNGKNVGTAVGDPEATGLKGMLPNALLQRFDAGGVDTRAAIADLGSMVVHDRSGAAVTAAEYPRLAPFIPTASDPPDAAKKKLENFQRVYQTLNDDARSFYTASGYNVPPLGGRQTEAAPAPSGEVRAGARRPAAAASPQRVQDAAAYNALPSGAQFVAPDGSVRVKP